MGRHRKFEWQQGEPSAPYPCYFGCGRTLETKFDRAVIDGWEWFCGYGARPVHFCPQCRRARQYDIDRIRERLNVKPPGYPATLATPD